MKLFGKLKSFIVEKSASLSNIQKEKINTPSEHTSKENVTPNFYDSLPASHYNEKALSPSIQTKKQPLSNATKAISASSPDPRRLSINRSLVEKLRNERKNRVPNTVRIPVLGAPSSGKSTLSKQLNIIYNRCFNTEEQRIQYRRIIRELFFYETRDCLHKYVSEGEDWQLLCKKTLDSISKILQDGDDVQHFEGSDLAPHTAKDLKTIWKDPHFREFFRSISDVGKMSDSIVHFLSSWERALSKDYIPSVTDILYFHDNLGYVETDLIFGRFCLKIVDMGTQRGNSLRWVRHAQESSAIIYCVALDEFDVPSTQSENAEGTPIIKTKLEESLELFERTCNWFPDKSIILFFTKDDLFRAKLRECDQGISLNGHKDYVGIKDYEKAIKAIQRKFSDCFNATNPEGQKILFPHVVNNINSQQIALTFAFSEVKDILMNDSGIVIDRRARRTSV